MTKAETEEAKSDDGSDYSNLLASVVNEKHPLRANPRDPSEPAEMRENVFGVGPFMGGNADYEH